MKRFSLVFMQLLIWAIATQAQEYQYVPFPDSGAVWSEMYTSEKTMLLYERFTITGEDTLINNMSYKKLYIFYEKTFNKNTATCIGGIREDEQKRVYYNGIGLHSFKPTRTEVHGAVLYDFSVSIGDTIKNGNLFYDDIVIEDIDTILIGNTLRRKFYLNYHSMEWIEGIGNTKGLLFTSGSLPTGGAGGDLICFIKNDTVLYHNEYYEDCFPTIVGIESKQTNFNIKVSPTSNRNNIRFEWGNSKIETIEIFNLKGSLIGTVSATGKNSVGYSSEKLLPGIYFYKATGPNNSTQTGKFAVQ
jgi:hypothetical protein